MTSESEKFLVSLADCKSFLEIGDDEDDDLIGYIMQGVSQMFDTQTARHLLEAEHTEHYNGNGTDTIMLRNYPVSTVVGDLDVRIDQYREFPASTQIDNDTLFIEASGGILSRQGRRFPRGVNIVRVIYTAGYAQADVPHELRLAALEALGVIWKRRGEKRFDTRTYSRGDVSYTYISEMPDLVVSTLRSYRRYG